MGWESTSSALLFFYCQHLQIIQRLLSCWLTGNQSLLTVGRVVWQGLRTNNSCKIVKYNHLQPRGELAASPPVTELPSLNIHPSAIIVSSNCHTTAPDLAIWNPIWEIISDVEIVLIAPSQGSAQVNREFCLNWNPGVKIAKSFDRCENTDGLDKKIIGKVFIKMCCGREAPETGAVHRWHLDLFLISRNICRSVLIYIT